MLNSLVRYIDQISRITLRGKFAYVSGDLRRYSGDEAIFKRIEPADEESRAKALKKVMNWLATAQTSMKDDGIGSYHLANGWGTSYPETTGYIIPTLLSYAEFSGDENFKNRALKAAGFLLSVQKDSGGWQGGRIGENKPEIVFNTGQVIRGFLETFLLTAEDKYLHSAKKAADWLCKTQHPEGYWKEHALMNEARVYDAYVDVPLIKLANISGNETYREAALKNLRWILDKKMNGNGWFRDCDNTVKHNDRPILHTIAYTLDGLIESDEMLKNGKFLDAARLGAGELKQQFLTIGRLYGRYDENWSGSEYFLCTGAAQMAIIWLRLYGLTKDGSYLQAADRALDHLIFIQTRNHDEGLETLGALPGSFPIWGKYEPFGFPNWASKFFADALMMRLQITS